MCRVNGHGNETRMGLVFEVFEGSAARSAPRAPEICSKEEPSDPGHWDQRDGPVNRVTSISTCTACMGRPEA